MDGTIQNKVWQGARLMVKIGFIATQLLLLLIPAYYIRQLVLERQSLQAAAVEEITGRWAGQQQLTGPLLQIPYIDNADGRSSQKILSVLPDSLSIDGNMQPRERHRGIYEVMLFETAAKMEARFPPLAVDELGLDAAQVLWAEARLVFKVADPRGLADYRDFLWNGEPLKKGRNGSTVAFENGEFRIPVTVEPGLIQQFNGEFDMRGSGKMLFSTVGNTNQIRIKSPWQDPSFQGEQLPQYEIDDKGFTADWRVMTQQRLFPQIWKDRSYNLQSASVGVDLFIPVNRYQQVLRSVKYATLVMVLTFVAFFLIETLSRQSVHALSYGLVGAALIIFYSLLLAIAEHLSFAASYWIATVATVTLIGWFTSRLLEPKRWSLIMALSLGLLYAYLFSLLQLEDYSLLLGSIGLFVALAITMGVATRLLKGNKA